MGGAGGGSLDGSAALLSFLESLDTPMICDCTTRSNSSQALYDAWIAAGIRVVTANPHYLPTFSWASSRRRFFDARAVLCNVVPLEAMLHDLHSAGDCVVGLRGLMGCPGIGQINGRLASRTLAEMGDDGINIGAALVESVPWVVALAHALGMKYIAAEHVNVREVSDAVQCALDEVGAKAEAVAAAAENDSTLLCYDQLVVRMDLPTSKVTLSLEQIGPSDRLFSHVGLACLLLWCEGGEESPYVLGAGSDNAKNIGAALSQGLFGLSPKVVQSSVRAPFRLSPAGGNRGSNFLGDKLKL